MHSVQVAVALGPLTTPALLSLPAPPLAVLTGPAAALLHTRGRPCCAPSLAPTERAEAGVARSGAEQAQRDRRGPALPAVAADPLVRSSWLSVRWVDPDPHVPPDPAAQRLAHGLSLLSGDRGVQEDVADHPVPRLDGLTKTCRSRLTARRGRRRRSRRSASADRGSSSRLASCATQAVRTITDLPAPSADLHPPEVALHVRNTTCPGQPERPRRQERPARRGPAAAPSPRPAVRASSSSRAPAVWWTPRPGHPSS